MIRSEVRGKMRLLLTDVGLRQWKILFPSFDLSPRPAWVFGDQA